mmetsp:Transcript_35821/g.100775  ORF Transcript_35821/g.100775 Transcript_35821/m.100775 type:complete len:323 (-) Transcript_35821:30-998(-)
MREEEVAFAGPDYDDYEMYAGYGGLDPTIPVKPHPRGLKALLLPMGLVFFVPLILFVVVFAAMSFSYNGGWAVLVIGIALTVAVCALAAYSVYGDYNDCQWHFLLALLMLFALVFAGFFGYDNYQQHAREYYNHKGMGSYHDIDPESTRPSLLMDASHVTFLPGFAPDATQGMGFKNRHVYCIAPIRSTAMLGNATKGYTYEYWAVGKDCCTAYGQNFIYSFRCGDYENPDVHGGLHVLSETDQSFYRLAVQQAEAVQGLESPTPVFVEWTADYRGALNSSYFHGRRNYVIGVVLCVIIQAIVVASALGVLEVLPRLLKTWS